MHRYHAAALDAERVRGLRDQVATARRGAGARAEPCTQAVTGVVCLHASASSGRQWQPLQRRLSGRYDVLLPDLYGSRTSPPWAAERELTLADEVALLEPVFQAAGGSPHLVGHSYGGAVAVHAALTHPGRFRSLVLIEPVLFGLLLDEDPGQPAAREILAVGTRTVAAVEVGALNSAGERFIDYWMGPGTWEGMPPERRAALAQTMPSVRSQWSAIFGDVTPLEAYSSLDLPTLYLVGSRSPASARAVARLLTKALHGVTTTELEGVGHMAPVTHADMVNEAIEAHIRKFG
jgi:pimeloyl-ACP methyl ester carboxylesterase